MMDYAQRLLDGADPDAMMAELRAMYKVTTLNSILSSIRKAVIARSPPPDYSALAAHRQQSVEVFLSLPLSEQLAIQRSHAVGTVDPWPEPFESALLALELTPACLQHLKLSPRECIELKRLQDKALLRRNTSGVITIEQPRLVLQLLAHLLQTATKNRSITALALPILLATGRRSAAVLNPKSTFRPHSNPMYCLFSGLLKKRGGDGQAIIPLLVPYSTLAVGVQALRDRQARNAHLETLDTPRAIKTRYQPGLWKAIRARDVLPCLPILKRVHDLRACYLAFIHQLYESPFSQAATCLTVLCHAKLKDSLAYSHVKVCHDESLAGSCGPLLVDESEDDSD